MMSFTEWATALVGSLVVVAGLVAVGNWQQERGKERVQEQMGRILHSGELPPMNQPPEVMPDNIKKERCRQSKECFKLAEALVFEARGETRKGQIAVASVILNRVDHKKFPDTIWGVVTQPHQFSYVGFEHLQQQPSAVDWGRALVIAYDVKNGIVERVTDATFYLNPKAVKRIPRWAREYEHVATIDNHAFYRYPLGYKTTRGDKMISAVVND